MSLVMQGSWTVSVKSKNAAFPQRFTISGASSGNGTHVAKPRATATDSFRNYVFRFSRSVSDIIQEG